MCHGPFAGHPKRPSLPKTQIVLERYRRPPIHQQPGVSLFRHPRRSRRGIQLEKCDLSCFISCNRSFTLNLGSRRRSNPPTNRSFQSHKAQRTSASMWNPNERVDRSNPPNHLIRPPRPPRNLAPHPLRPPLRDRAGQDRGRHRPPDEVVGRRHPLGQIMERTQDQFKRRRSSTSLGGNEEYG